MGHVEVYEFRSRLILCTSLLGNGVVPADYVFGKVQSSLSKPFSQFDWDWTQHEGCPGVEASWRHWFGFFWEDDF
jgi:hypothetical protein